MCPDAYSFAFDDRASTFVVPALTASDAAAGGGGGGVGWEVRFCPGGRSTDILGVMTGSASVEGGVGGVVDMRRWKEVKEGGAVGGAAGGGVGRAWMGAFMVVAAVGLVLVL